MDDAIAVIGMACRYPGGADTPELLWELVAEGRDAIGDFPKNRGWDLEALHHPDGGPGTTYVRQGGFLYDADTFDAAFFGIRPAEALGMDPQQRILLEVAWEAIERAGIVPSSLKGMRTGVFVGLMPNEYGMPLGRWQGETSGYMATGTSPSVASGRISYLLGLEGPAITVDTACSSSLVAIHTAVRSLRSGETELALAAGSTVQAGPGMFQDFSRQRALSPDGRCRTFSDTANGTAWAEGAGVLVLEPLAKARRLGRRILGVIRGSAVNQDGASNGLSAPSGKAQAKVIEQALADAGLRPQDIDLVEAHGTGTKLGDPVEAGAIISTYGRDRSDQVWLGSLKSNIGHSMAAAGVGGVIKCLLAMRAGVMPKSLHVEELNSHVSWPETVDVLREAREWPERDGVRRCAVSAFAVSGTNSHVVLESVTEPEEERPATAGVVALTLSAKTPEALAASAAAVAEVLSHPPAAVARSLACEREHFAHRAVVVGGDRDSLLTGLGDLVAGTPGGAAVTGEARRVRQPVFVFPGQGSQWAGMATELFSSTPVFRAKVGECAEAFAPHLGFSLLDALADGLDTEATDVVQPMIFTMMVALAAMWQDAGVRPAAVIGHSQGEVAAAHVAGALSLADAARIVAGRSRAIERSGGAGGMMVVAATESEATALISEAAADLVVAAVNAPRSLVLAGNDEQGAARLLALCEAKDVYARRVPVRYASHSPAVEPLRAEIMAALRDVRPVRAAVPIYSTVDAAPVRGDELDAGYWYRNLRSRVRFADTVAVLAERGYDAFVEISPHPVVTGAIEAVLAAQRRDAPVCATLRRDRGGADQFLAAAGQAHVQGHEIDWARLLPAAGRVDLPTYRFERQRFWLSAAEQPAAVARRSAPARHPWLGSAVALPGDAMLLSGELSLRSHPWLMDHRVNGAIFLPGTAFVEMLLHAGAHAGYAAIEEFVLNDPLVVPLDGAPVEVQVAVTADHTATIHSRTSGGDWVKHGEAVLTVSSGVSTAAPSGGRPVAPDEMYTALAGAGYGYGEAFQAVRGVHDGGDVVTSDVRLSDAALVNHGGFTVHPALVDAALHAALGCGLFGDVRKGLVVPFLFAGVRVGRDEVGDACTVVARRAGEDEISLALLDSTGAVLLSIDRVVVRRLRGPSARLHWLDWSEPEAAETTARLCVVGAGDDPLSAEVRQLAQVSVSTLAEAALITGAAPDEWQVVVPCADDEPHAASARALRLVQEWLNHESPGRLVLVTRSSVAVPGDTGLSLGTSPVWGIVRSAQSEHPGVFRVVDGCGAGLAEALRRDEPQLVVRSGGLLRPAIVPAAPPGEPDALPEGTVVITGGTGTIGRELARHLVTSLGATSVALISRSGERSGAVAELRDELGERLLVVAADIADAGQAAAALAEIRSHGPIVGVVHAAGVLRDSTIAAMTEDQLHEVLRGKADSAVLLDALTAHDDLAFFVLFSSVYGVLGGPGQANYAAANTFLDQFAAWRREQGRPATSVAWGLWEEASGMTGHLGDADLQRLRRNGIVPFPVSAGLAMFDAALAADTSFVVAAELDVSGLADVPFLLTSLAPQHRAPVVEAVTEDAASLLAVAATAQDRRAVVRDVVIGCVAGLLGVEPRRVDARRSFFEMGFDSLTSTELRGRVGKRLGVRVGATAVFDHPTPEALTTHVAELVGEPVEENRSVAPLLPIDDGKCALTPLQEAYVAGRSSEFELGDVSTYIHIEADLTGFDLAAAERALRLMVRRHEMLRAVFSEEGHFRVLDEVPDYSIEVEDLRGRADQEARLDWLRADLETHEFDRSRWPLFRATATRLDDRTTRLHFGVDVLIADGSSAAALFNEWADLYHDPAAVRQVPEATFREYTARLREFRASDRMVAARSYWQDRLTTLPPAPDLPLAVRLGEAAAPVFGHRSITLAAPLWTKLKQLGAGLGVTPSAAICTAYCDVLAKWAKSPHFAVNVLVSNRQGFEGEDLSQVVGNFSSTSLLEVRVDPGLSFTERARVVQRQLAQDMEHAAFTGVDVTRELNRLDGGAGRARMPVVFTSTLGGVQAAHNGPAGLIGALARMGESGTTVASGVRTPQVTLDHQAVEEAGVLRLNWDVVEEVFPAGMIDAMLAEYERTVLALCEAGAWHAPEPAAAPIAEVRDPEKSLLHAGFFEQASRTPDAVAVISGARTLTYAELAAEALVVAAELAERGHGPGSLVGVVMDKGWEQVVACLGVLRAGAAYVPVDARWPAKRMHGVLESAGITAVLTQPWHRIEWPEGLWAREIQPGPAEVVFVPDPAVGPDDLAYVIYTSGSTGVPKGVMIEHAAALNTIRDVNEELSLISSDRVFALSALNFDLSVYDLFGPLSVGGAVVVPAAGDEREPAAWLRQMTEHGVTVWNSVPALMAMLCEYAESADVPLRAVLLSGDWIPVTLPADIRRLFPDAAQWGLGGATEASIWSIWHRIRPEDAELASIPYGVSMRNQHVYVGDERLCARPVWAVGDIYIGGAGVARGYLGDAERTASSFVTDPATGGRWYRTGDLGRLLPSGEIEFLGREDTQVKIGGHRIELGDVESALESCPGVRTAVATVRAGRLAAHVLVEPGTTSASVRAGVADALPGYMVPSVLSVLDEFPLTANGKVDRAALSALPASTDAEVEKPADAEEEVLLGLWRGFFGTDELSVTDDFFDLGGDSLQAVRLVSLVRQATGVEMRVSTLFAAPTIRALARWLSAAAPSGVVVPIRTEGSAVPLILAHPIGGEVLSYADLAGRLGPDQPVYGLRSPDGHALGLTDLAAEYARAVCREVPGTRYRVGGWSMGGMLAIEIARELEASGCEVDLVLALDIAESPSRLAAAVIDQLVLLSWLARDLAGLAGVPWAGGDFGSAGELFPALRSAGILPEDIAFADFEAVCARFEANARALYAYRPDRFGGVVHFVQAASGTDPGVVGEWRALCDGQFEHQVVPGDHYTMVQRRHVDVLADVVRQLLS
ncbi:amino acid adenylation domain-containing protein [Lentzea sp. NPDC051838]|uniref:non-ribosomal peptide synthetase/type I polyketide synthase n=1 Tax=Lentzea sp. NPDC051838 TaxID=3154849 RepID=UPI00341E29F5